MTDHLKSMLDGMSGTLNKEIEELDEHIATLETNLTIARRDRDVFLKAREGILGALPPEGVNSCSDDNG